MTQRYGISLGVSPREPLIRTSELARAIDESGFEVLWYIDFQLGMKDVYAAMNLAALSTKTALIGAGVTNLVTRHPTVTANATVALDELSEGRFVAGIGAGSRVLIKAQGINFVKPLKALREYVEACRKVWNAHGSHFDYHGEMVHLDNAELDFEPVRRDLPVWLGPTGPLACQLTGEIAEGASLNAFLGTEYVTWALEHLNKGAERGGRTLDDVEVGMMLVACVDDSKEAARAFLRPLLALYLARLPDITRRTSVWGPDGAGWKQLVAAVDEGGGEGGQHLISDEVIDDLTLNGTRDDCLEGMQRYIDAGVEHPIITAIGDIERGIEELAPQG